MDPDTESELLAGEGVSGHVFMDSDGHLGEDLCVICARLGNPRRRHVAVADGLDLLDTEFVGHPIDEGEDLVEELHELVCGHL